MKKQVEYWKEQAGLAPAQRDFVDLLEIADTRPAGSGDGPAA